MRLKVTRRSPVSELPELLRVPEVAAWLDVSRAVVYGEISRGNLPAVRFGRLVRVPRSALKRFVEREQIEVRGAGRPVAPVGTATGTVTATEPVASPDRAGR